MEWWMQHLSFVMFPGATTSVVNKRLPSHYLWSQTLPTGAEWPLPLLLLIPGSLLLHRIDLQSLISCVLIEMTQFEWMCCLLSFFSRVFYALPLDYLILILRFIVVICWTNYSSLHKNTHAHNHVVLVPRGTQRKGATLVCHFCITLDHILMM